MRACMRDMRIPQAQTREKSEHAHESESERGARARERGRPREREGERGREGERETQERTCTGTLSAKWPRAWRQSAEKRRLCSAQMKAPSLFVGVSQETT